MKCNFKKTQNLQRQTEKLKEENQVLIEKTKIVDMIQKEFSKKKIEYLFYHCMLNKLLFFLI